MGNTELKNSGPDFSLGVLAAEFPASGLLTGHAGGDVVLVVRSGEEYFAVGANCTHYGASLAEGVLIDDTVRCPWHHACFSLRTGEAIRAPAFDALACWQVEQRDGKIFVTAKKTPLPQPNSEPVMAKSAHPSRIVIVGGGAAGFAAAEMLRRCGYVGGVLMISADSDLPVDRPNLSKDYLAGTAPEEWVPLKSENWYVERDIDLRLNTEVVNLHAGAHEIELGSGVRVPYDRLLLATGAEPVRLALPGADQDNVYTLRSLADCRRIIAAAQPSSRVVVIGASFIGLEVAAALRARNLHVHVVAPEKRPLERVFGAELGHFIHRLHEEHGVVFHLENTVTAIEGNRLHLRDDSILEADFVVMGVGVRPRTSLAEKAGLRIDRGVRVSECLETSAPDVFAAGDLARWPDRRSGKDVRVEHWVVAERLGQTVARNMLGARERYEDVPFFWSQHYDVPINYVGHAESWDELTVEGDVASRDCVVRYRRNGRMLAAASIYRDVQNLEAELALEAEGRALKAAVA
jgi:NADPH-dependent 2,4-dienoyl-CoA reductase/sulfur reductase-like enzyme/nitrite reductase/ring-hydroxylating ferredoxin subunit